MKIYLISAYLNGETLYKIGITRRAVEKRLKELKTGNAAELKIIEVFESKWATKIETNFHVSLASRNVGGGEWFVLSDDDVNNFISRCKELHGNFELLFKTNSWFSNIMNK